MNVRKVVAAATLAACLSLGAQAAGSGPKKPIEQAVAGEWRSADAKSRDVFRHPVDALAFWGLKPRMTILEVQPGGGWWTEILAPYARLNKGEFYATAADLDNPELSEGARKARADYAAKYGDAGVYGKVNLVNWGTKSAPLPANKFDFVLLARVFHGWVRQGVVDANLKKIYDGTKPGGIVAIEQHRAPAGQDPAVWNGYVDEAYVIAQMEKAGFKLDKKSEINANPKDTKDHPWGVWMLPPTRRSAPEGQPANPDFDHAKYDAIGESDRMTLRFVKPRK
jgi:predicted methyltransferase